MSSSPPPPKKPRKTATTSQRASSPGPSSSSSPSSSSTKSSKLSFIQQFSNDRQNTAESVLDFEFRKKRIRILSTATEVKSNANGIVYWMSRDRRVQDNWAFLFAQKLALKNHIALHVCFCLVPTFLHGTLRHYRFMLPGLEQVENECRSLNIQFHLLFGEAATEIPKFVRQHKMGGVVCDFSPLRIKLNWLNIIKDTLPDDIPLCQVDAHNIVPVWVTSDKAEYAARTIRPKITKNLGTYLTEFPPIIQHPYDAGGGGKKLASKKIDWKKAFEFIVCDESVDECKWARPGYEAAVEQLQSFCEHRLSKFGDKRNDPLVDALSNLAPWFNFGHISVQRCILAVRKYSNRYKTGVEAFCEEAIIRRELSDNFCFYNEHYDSIKGLASWAQETLNAHKKDKRDWIYSRKELETAKTHDDLWNSAQLQLLKDGKIHGFLRMYWAKKILEWTKSPEDALEISLYLNDRYSLDGIDPNGYVGCMWSIGGIHDQGWAERSIFGKIRYMNYKGCERKFDVKAFVARYGGKVYGNDNNKEGSKVLKKNLKK